MMKAVRKGKVKRLGEMAFIRGGGAINWFPGHMAAATRAIRDRLKVVDIVIEVRDSRIPLSSVNANIQPLIADKMRVIALNKSDLAERDVLPKWVKYFGSETGVECVPVNSHHRNSVNKLLELVKLKLKDKMSREPTLLVMVVGVPNVGKSAMINCIHQISRSHVQERSKRATVGPLPGVTQDIAGFKIGHQPSIYVLDSPGVLVPSIPDIETGLKLALSGSVKDSEVGEERIAQYLLAVLNRRGTPLQWKQSMDRLTALNRQEPKKPDNSKSNFQPKKQPQYKSIMSCIETVTATVQQALYATLSDFKGDTDDEDNLEELIDHQFEALQKALQIPQTTCEARMMISKRLITLFRAGKLGDIILDDLPNVSDIVM